MCSSAIIYSIFICLNYQVACEDFEDERNTEIAHYFCSLQVKAYNVGISRLAKSEKPQHTVRM
jgi:hypothetical protein